MSVKYYKFNGIFIGLLVSIINIQATPFTIRIASSMEKIKKEILSLSQTTQSSFVSLDMAKDESESFQLIIVSDGQKLNNVTVRVKGLDTDNLTLRWFVVDYVKCGKSSYSPNKVNWMPDPLMTKETFAVNDGELQPLWFSVLTSSTTLSGNYNCTIEVMCGSDVRTMSINIKVRNFILPRPGTLATPFGNYRKVLEDWYFGAPGLLAKRHYDRWCNFLSEYRLTPKEIGTEYVKETKVTVATNETKVTDVDYYSLLNTLPVITKNYLPDYSYHFYRLPSGSTLETALKTPGHWWHDPAKLAAPIFTYWEKWKKAGFTDKVFVYGVDEPNSEISINGSAAIYKEIKKINPDLKIMVTGNCNRDEFKGLVDIWCPKTKIAWNQFFIDRLKEGNTLWQYVCVTPGAPYANLFIDEPGVDHRNLFWQTRKLGATGFLYWTVMWVDKYPEKAFSSSLAFPNSPWDYTVSSNPTGDGMLIYPGKNYTPIPSIRLEIVRDGIEDYEYFSVLEKLIKNIERDNTNATIIDRATNLLNIPNTIVTNASVYTINESLMLNYRTQLADAIEELLSLSIGDVGDNGTKKNPYKIKNAIDLKALADKVNEQGETFIGKYFLVTDNIDLGGAEWTPIGGISSSLNFEKIFKGNIDGAGFNISNFSITQSIENGIGFIGYMENGSIKNLTISNASICGKTYVGGMVGYMREGNIYDCHVQITVKGQDFVGGIVGNAVDTDIIQCSSSGVVNGVNYVGGIAGGSYDFTK